MSLVSNLMNNSTGNFGMIDASKYTHDTGALRIATESIEELHEIFIEGFYNVEQAELAAMQEGVALEGSQYESVIEASSTSALTKIKDFFKKLWEKVKAFFHSMKRYIDAIFMEGKKFAKKYEADIKNANKNIKDFEFKVFNYTHIDEVEEIDVEEMTEGLLKSSTGFTVNDLNKLIDSDVRDKGLPERDPASGSSYYQAHIAGDNKSKHVAEIPDEAYDKLKDRDNAASNYFKARGMKVSSADDIGTECYKYFRDGARDKDDMDDIKITDLTRYADVLKEFNSSKLDKMANRMDKSYKKAIDIVNKAEKSLDSYTMNGNKLAYAPSLQKYLSNFASALSTMQGFENTFMNAWKSAAKERDSAYKQLIVKGISHANKKAKENK